MSTAPTLFQTTQGHFHVSKYKVFPVCLTYILGCLLLNYPIWLTNLRNLGQLLQFLVRKMMQGGKVMLRDWASSSTCGFTHGRPGTYWQHIFPFHRRKSWNPNQGFVQDHQESVLGFEPWREHQITAFLFQRIQPFLLGTLPCFKNHLKVSVKSLKLPQKRASSE